MTHTITSADITAGSVSLTVTAGDLGADGSKSISAKFTDAAGNSSTTSALAVTLDTTAPTGGTPDLVAASDSGTSATDNITAVTSPTFTVALNPTVAAGDTVQLLLGGSALAHNVTHTITSADITAGSVSLTVTAGDLGADGSKSISAKFTDAAGNSSTTSALAVTLDTTAPTGGTPDLVAASDSGVSATDNITAITSPTFTVALNPTVAAGDTVQLLLGGSALAHNVTHTITSADITAGSVSLTVTAGDLGADGSKSISAKFTDAAGNSSTTSALAVTLDTTAPTGGTPDLVAASDSGVSATDNITAVTSPTFTVALNPTVAAGDTVQLLLGGSALAHNVTHTITSADITAGSVSLTVTAGDLGADGSKSISAKFTDAAGNSSTTSALAVTVDTVAPNAPVITSDAIVNTDEVMLTGTAEANSTVNVFDGTTLLATATTDSSGAWGYTTSPLNNGPHAFTTTATDAAGNTSPASQVSDPIVGGTVIEANGATSLIQVGNQYYLDDNTGAVPPLLKYLGTPYAAGQYGAWTPIAAEKTATGYEVAWKFGNADQYTVWTTDSNGNYVSNIVRRVSGTSAALESLETSFHQDLNGDGQIGISTTVIEVEWRDKPDRDCNHYYMIDSTGSGPSLKIRRSGLCGGSVRRMDTDCRGEDGDRL